jgi:hypothetical protein
MVTLAETKRIEYEGYAPVFWRKAPDSSPKQERYLQSLTHRARHHCVRGTRGRPPRRVRHRGADDGTPRLQPRRPGLYCRRLRGAPPEAWHVIGEALLAAVAREAQARGAGLRVVVCAQRDQAKRALLREAGCSVASEWHVKPL